MTRMETCFDPVAEFGDQRLVGIDPSLTGLAVCVYYRHGEYGMQRFSSKPASGVAERLERYTELAEKAIAGIPTLSQVFIEGYSYQSAGSVIATAEFGGLFRYLLARRMHRTPCGPSAFDASGIVEVPPTTLKKFVLGKGVGDKTAMAMGAFKRWQVEFATSDEVDAYALARLGACYMNWASPENDKQREVLEVLRGGPKQKKSKTGA